MSECIKILSLDGGGIRGVAPAMFLEQLESGLDASLYESFDLIAGTSTGALIALLIAANKATGKDCVDLYNAKNAQTIMDKSFWDRTLPVQNQPKYDGKGKLKILKRTFDGKHIKNVKKDTLVVAYDMILRRIVVFKSFGAGVDSKDNPSLVEIADASSAAPTYFPTVETSDKPARWLIDGGVAANNPSMCALSEALKQSLPENIKMVSIGTGIQTRGKSNPAELGKASQTWGGLGWLAHGLVDHLFAGNSSATAYHCKQILGDNFIRVDGPLMYCNDDLDDVSQGNIDNLQRLGKEWYNEYGNDVVTLLTP